MQPTFISIVNGSYSNREISGTFEVTQSFKPYTPSEFKSGYAKEGFSGYVRVIFEEKARYVHIRDSDSVVTSNNVTTTKPEPIETSVEDIITLDAKIKRRFSVMDIMSAGVISGNVRSLIISGAPGIGKTFTFERDLSQAEEEGTIGTFTHIKGKLTPLYLFKTLFENCNKGDVLLLDDADDVFYDETSMNILKGALDSSEERWITYGSATRWLEDNGIPSTFKFEGSVVFITNYNFDKMIASNSKLAPHFSALISRSSYLDLAIHDKLEIMVRVQQIATETDVLSRLGIDEKTADKMVKWCWDNYTVLRELSIRTLLKIADYAKLGDWEMLANEMLIA